MRMKRAVGYCQEDQCEDYCKGVFLLNHGNKFNCPRCREQGYVEPERGSYEGASLVFKEVRVEHNYCAMSKTYSQIAIVRDESLWGTCSTYVLHSPLIKTEKRALCVAEGILSNLNKFAGKMDLDNEIPSTMETMFSFDVPIEELKAKLAAFSKELESSPLAQASRMEVK
jgi:ribosomal protein S27AE